ncbi:MAG: hypothetical protein Q4C66_11070 [Lachnospiraceae bacterium]|nr:hypothetical protein [Lachnospiraceae bacterium]
MMREIKNVVNSNNALRTLVQPLRVMKRKIIEYKMREVKKSFGSNCPDKTIYVIRRADANCGLFSYFITVLGHLKIADENGYIPVVDMQNYENTYLYPNELGKINSWDYFFEPVGNISLKEAYRSKNVILSDSGIPNMIPEGTISSLMNEDGAIDKWRILYKKYIHLRTDVKAKMDQERSTLFQPGERILGVICRGTDYTKFKPVGHWVQPEASVIIEKAHTCLAEWNCDKIFLATEDTDVYEEFKAAFPGKVIVNSKQWVQYDGKQGINNYGSSRENDKMLQGLEYLTTIYILSHCNCLIGGRAGGTVGAMVMSEGYEEQYFWDLGKYGFVN